MKDYPNDSLKVFLDANVFIAAVLSDKGGSFYITQQAIEGEIQIFTSSFVIKEVMTRIAEKYPQKLSYAYTLLSNIPLNFVKEPDETETERIIPILEDSKDIPVIAAALKIKAEFFITLDRKHFFTDKIKRANLPITILTPKDFIQSYLK